MKVRRFVANNMQEAMMKVKTFLGKDAVILHTRKFREGGIFGLFGKDLVEVTAAVEDDRFSTKPQETLPSSEVSSSSETLKQSFASSDINIRKELDEVKNLLNHMVNRLEENSSVQENRYPKSFQKVFRVLRANEVEERLAHRLIQDSLEQLQPSAWQDEEVVAQTVENLIAKRLLRPKPIKFRKSGEKKRIALVGPTGVGKTTTIAKLAAIFAILEKRSVALATVDTYRVAAVEQLKTYAEIIDVPLEVAYTPKELRIALEKHNDKELILIDTAGRSPLNEQQMRELKAFLESPQDVIEVFLVLGATTKQSDLWETITRFSQIPISNLVFTKLDETRSYGVILNVVNRLRKSLAYVTTGQSVPDDIEVPDPQKIARLILQGRG